jgi:two-component system response regulator RegX3
MDKILILTDAGAGDSLLRTILQDEGFLLFLPSGAREDSLRHLRTLEADAIIIDAAEGGRRPAELCCRLHACIGIKPTIILGNSDEETDKVIALESGADDYMVKPFAARELIARLNAVLRRRSGNRASIVGFDNIEVNRATSTVKRDGRVIEMTRCEYRLLSFFLSNVDLALKRETLLAAVWGYVDGSRSRTLDAYVRRLRLKCEQDPANPVRIITIHGVGYRFRGPLITGEGESVDMKNDRPHGSHADSSPVLNTTQSLEPSIAATE